MTGTTTGSNTVSALLLDYGGVLTTPVGEAFAAFCREEDIDEDVFRRVVLGGASSADSPVARVETGAITQEEFDEAVAALLSDACAKPISSRRLKQRLFATVKPDEEMVAAVRRARREGIRTLLLSNSWGGRDYPRSDFGELFDAVVISGECSMRKPEPGIYRHAATVLGVEPDRCVFVDDLVANVRGAEAVGMTGIVHTDAGETIPLLERLLGVPLR